MFSDSKTKVKLIYFLGIAYWVDKKSNAQIHLLGNVVLWYSGSLSIFVYSALLIFYLLRRRRHVFDLNQEQWNRFTVSYH